MAENPWLIPFKGRNSSNAYNQNFLWNHESIYIMDNHRAALWCWYQHISTSGKISIFHIDAHYDARPPGDKLLKKCMDLRSSDIGQFLDASHETDDEVFPLMLWDNYFPVFFEHYQNNIKEFVFCTHKKGCHPQNFHITEIALEELPNNLEYFILRKIKLPPSETDWVVNIDFDFFFCQAPKDSDEYDGNSKKIPMFSEAYIENIFKTIKNKYRNGEIKVITAAFSPECCGGWENAEAICKIFCDVMKLDFKLP